MSHYGCNSRWWCSSRLSVISHFFSSYSKGEGLSPLRPGAIFRSAPFIDEQTRGIYWNLFTLQKTFSKQAVCHWWVLNLLLWLIYECSSYLSFHLSSCLIHPILIKFQIESSLRQRISLLCCFQSFFLYSGTLICNWKVIKILNSLESAI